jgi:hypothetical protein
MCSSASLILALFQLPNPHMALLHSRWIPGPTLGGWRSCFEPQRWALSVELWASEMSRILDGRTLSWAVSELGRQEQKRRTKSDACSRSKGSDPKPEKHVAAGPGLASAHLSFFPAKKDATNQKQTNTRPAARFDQLALRLLLAYISSSLCAPVLLRKLGSNDTITSINHLMNICVHYLWSTMYWLECIILALLIYKMENSFYTIGLNTNF